MHSLTSAEPLLRISGDTASIMIRKPVQDFFLFLVGGALFSAGIFLFTNQVMVGSGFHGMGWGRRFGGGMGSSFGGMFAFDTGQGFGLLMIPVCVQGAGQLAANIATAEPLTSA